VAHAVWPVILRLLLPFVLPPGGLACPTKIHPHADRRLRRRLRSHGCVPSFDNWVRPHRPCRLPQQKNPANSYAPPSTISKATKATPKSPRPQLSSSNATFERRQSRRLRRRHHSRRPRSSNDISSRIPASLDPGFVTSTKRKKAHRCHLPRRPTPGRRRSPAKDAGAAAYPATAWM